ncbi:MAG: hypothetical protein AAGD10_13655 [Myxococcota bacterium]
MMNPEEMSTADQLLLGIMKAIEHDIWDLAELMARTLAQHIQATGEYPEALPPSELDRLVQQHQTADAFGPS